MTLFEMAMMHGGAEEHGGMGGMDGMDAWMSGWMFAWLLVGLALFALAVAATVWLIRNMSGSGRGNDALRELDMRYARGELDSDEYDERRQRIHHR